MSGGRGGLPVAGSRRRPACSGRCISPWLARPALCPSPRSGVLARRSRLPRTTSLPPPPPPPPPAAAAAASHGRPPGQARGSSVRLFCLPPAGRPSPAFRSTSRRQRRAAAAASPPPPPQPRAALACRPRAPWLPGSAPSWPPLFPGAGGGVPALSGSAPLFPLPGHTHEPCPGAEAGKAGGSLSRPEEPGEEHKRHERRTSRAATANPAQAQDQKNPPARLPRPLPPARLAPSHNHVAPAALGAGTRPAAHPPPSPRPIKRSGRRQVPPLRLASW